MAGEHPSYPTSDKRPYLFLTVLFILTRAFYRFLGVGFDAGPLGTYYQYLDPLLLKTDLLRSLFYLREQPPGFNLFLGIILKLSPVDPQRAFHAAFVATGCIGSLCLYTLMVRLRIRPWLALTLVSIFLAAPSTILYENWLLYGYPVMCLLNIAALELHRFLSGGKTYDAFIFCLTLAALWSFHSMFHLFWFLLVVTGLLLVCRHLRGKIWIAASVPALLLLGISAKNFMLFGDWAPGAQVFQTTTYAVLVSQLTPSSVINQLVAQGKITRILKMPVYASVPSEYRDLVPEPPPTGIRALDQPIRSTGMANWNSRWMTRIGALYKKDALTLNAYYPQGRIQSLWANFALYFFPAEDVDPFTNPAYKNVKVIDSIFRIYDYAISGQFRRKSAPWISWIAIPAILLFGSYRSLRWSFGAIRGQEAWRDSDSLIVVFLTFDILYGAVVSIMIPHGDQNRYRDSFAGHYLILFALLLNTMISAVSGKCCDSNR
jgi:hypothetical protein